MLDVAIEGFLFLLPLFPVEAVALGTAKMDEDDFPNEDDMIEDAMADDDEAMAAEFEEEYGIPSLAPLDAPAAGLTAGGGGADGSSGVSDPTLLGMGRR